MCYDTIEMSPKVFVCYVALVRKTDKFLIRELGGVAYTCTRRLRREDHKFEANLSFILRFCLRNKSFFILLMIHNKYSSALIRLTDRLLQQYIFPICIAVPNHYRESYA